jgi:hypothetical protein
MDKILSKIFVKPVMRYLSLLSRFRQWIQSAEIFLRPSQKIIGRWLLFEYYTEPGDELINVKQDKLIKDKLFLEMEFDSRGIVNQDSNLEVSFWEDMGLYNWRLSGNFLKLSSPCDNSKSEKFQYSVQKNYLKLLKKDINGKIIFFGFFRKQIEDDDKTFSNK